jgi:hypothetical protein
MAVGNLELINSFEVTSTVTSFDCDNVFSANYDVYMIAIDGIQEVTAPQWLRIRFLDSTGTVITASEYDYAQLRMPSNGAFAQEKNTAQDNLLYAGIGYTNDGGTNSILYVYNPYDSGSYTFVQAQSSFTSGVLQGTKGIGVHKSAETVRGIHFYQSSGNFGSGFFRIYGLASN